MNPEPLFGVFPWKPAAWLRVTGPDASSFLQGQFTNDLRAQSGTGAVYGLWLTVKGKVLADSFVLRASADEYWVGSYFCPAETIRQRLEGHIIADDVAVEDLTTSWAGLTLFGVPTPDQVRPDGAFAFSGRRIRAAHLEWVVPSEAAPALRTHFATLPELSAEVIAAHRIADGIPAIPADLGPADLPNEAGLDVDAISYTKGCYLGQEVMARLKSMGQVRRRLLRVESDSNPPPAVPCPLFVGDKQVGELRSVAREGARWIGLAMVSLLNAAGAPAVSLAAGAGPTVRFIDAP